MAFEVKVYRPATNTSKWVQRRRANHYFDCECMALAAALIAGADRMMPTDRDPERVAVEDDNIAKIVEGLA